MPGNVLCVSRIFKPVEERIPAYSQSAKKPAVVSKERINRKSKPMSKSHSNSPNKKRPQKMRWAVKKTPAQKSKENKFEMEHKQNDFRYGPSAMYTVPRSVPKSHSHIIGQTAAVGTANAFHANPYASNNNRFGTSMARPYTTSRRHNQFGQKKAKTYGDYEDELPHTPSGSEDDS